MSVAELEAILNEEQGRTTIGKNRQQVLNMVKDALHGCVVVKVPVDGEVTINGTLFINPELVTTNSVDDDLHKAGPTEQEAAEAELEPDPTDREPEEAPTAKAQGLVNEASE